MCDRFSGYNTSVGKWFSDIKKKLPRISPWLVIVLVIIIAIAIAGFFAVRAGVFGRNAVTTTINRIGERQTQSESSTAPERLTVVQSKVILEKEGKGVELAEGESTDLAVGDKITTDLNGVVELVYPSGTTVRVGSDSVVTFTSSNSLGIDVGEVYVRFVKLLGVQEEYEVESSDVVAVVRGSAFSFIAEPGLDPKIAVSDHEVDVIPKDKDGKWVLDQKKVVKVGEQAVLTRVNRVLTTSPQKLSDKEKDWLDFNNKSDQGDHSHDMLKNFKSLRKKTSTPSPTASPVPSAKPVEDSSPGFSAMPGAGYHKGKVSTSVGTFTLACYGAARGSVRMLTDSASDSDCTDNCPVLPLADYATRNGGVAAMNGMYFCPADYPSCAGKVNTFDTLFFNSRTHQYMNSANNVYSNIPFVGMNSDHGMSFVGSSSSWGRDTGIIGGTAGNPRLIAGGNYAINLDALDDKQRNVKSNRGAIVSDGDNLYLCITQAATVPDSARVYETLGVSDAINVDGGGSSALWVQGAYKYGPGRQIPTAIILAP